MPRERSRSSAIAFLASLWAPVISACAPSGSLASFSCAMPRSIASATSRACAPSWRSRSIRCSSAAWASTAPARVRSSSIDAAALAGGEQRCGRARRGRRPARASAATVTASSTSPTGTTANASCERVDVEQAVVDARRGTDHVPGGQEHHPERRRPRRDGDDEAREAEHGQQDQPSHSRSFQIARVADRGVQGAEHPAAVRREVERLGSARASSQPARRRSSCANHLSAATVATRIGTPTQMISRPSPSESSDDEHRERDPAGHE